MPYCTSWATYSRNSENGRIGHHDVRLLQKLDAFRAAEIPIPFKLTDSNIPNVGHPAAHRVPLIFEPYRPLRIVTAEQVAVLVLVARGDELLQAQAVEVVREVMKEVGDAGIVAIAVHTLVTEVSGVVAQLVLDVGKLGVELVVLLPLGFSQVFIQRHGFAPASSPLSATSSRYLSRLCSPPTSALCYIIPLL